MVQKPVPWSPLFRSSTDVIKCVCVIMLVYALSFWNKLILLVGGRGHDGLFFEMAIVCFMSHTFKPMSHHLWLNSGTISSHCFNVLVQIMTLLLLSKHCMNLAAIWHMFRFTFRMFHTHPDEIPNLLSTSWVVILVFKDKWLHTFNCFACQWRSHIFSTFNRDHTALELEKNDSQTYVLPTVRCPQATFIILKMCIPF
jgi:hypothetical protein